MGLNTLAPDFEPVRVGLVGVGRHARQILLPALELVPEIRLVALSTAHDETARLAGERYRVPHYTGFEAMIRSEQLEAVLVVGGPHGPVMLSCLTAGLHVWCETPAVTSQEIAADVRAVARESGRIVEVGSCLRHAPIYQRLKKELDCWRRDCPGPRLIQCRYYPYIGHFYNLLMWLNGEIAEVCAARADDETLVMLRFENGDLGSITACRFNNDSVPFEEVTITADTGMLVAENGLELRRYRTRERKAAVNLEFGSSDVEAWIPSFSMPYGKLNQLYLRGYVPELEHFARRVRCGADAVSGLDDMEATFLIRQAVDRSVTSRAWEPVGGLRSLVACP